MWFLSTVDFDFQSTAALSYFTHLRTIHRSQNHRASEKQVVDARRFVILKRVVAQIAVSNNNNDTNIRQPDYFWTAATGNATATGLADRELLVTCFSEASAAEVVVGGSITADTITGAGAAVASVVVVVIRDFLLPSLMGRPRRSWWSRAAPDQLRSLPKSFDTANINSQAISQRSGDRSVPGQILKSVVSAELAIFFP